MFVLSTAIFFVLAIYFLFMGSRTLLSRRPAVFAAKSAFWLILVSILPSLLFPLHSFWKHYLFLSEHSFTVEWKDGLVLLIPLVMYPVLLIFYWRILRGYSVLGITDESFRTALYSVLDELGLPYEERLSKMHLPSLGADLEVNVNERFGTAALRVKQKEHQNTLDSIAGALKRYFAGSHVATNNATSVFYLIFGFLTLAAAIGFAYFFVAKDF